jgi:hypothetical protein
MTIQLVSQSIPLTEISSNEILEMYALFQSHYDQTTYEIFIRDLSNKNWVVILRDAENANIEGFSTLAFYESTIEGHTVGVVFSGDTIIRKKFWGTPELPKQWIETVLKVGQELHEPLYWLLISSGYKTYRFLPVFFKEFYPRYDRATPKDYQKIIDQLANERFGEDYHQSAGVVRFSEGATPLAKGVADMKSSRLQDKHVMFFQEKNPDHACGDELVCVTVIHPENFTAAGKRMVR